MNKTDTSITEEINQTFEKILQNATYNWSVNCTDSFGNVGASSTYNLTLATSDIIASSCNQSDVQTAINNANSGNVVIIPEGNCVWGDSASYVIVNKSITLQGAGQNLTIINISTTASSWASGTIRVTDAATVKDFTIQTNESSGNSGTAFSVSANFCTQVLSIFFTKMIGKNN